MNIDPANLLALISTHVGQIAQLEQRIAQLEAQLAKDTPNVGHNVNDSNAHFIEH